ncbi:hypothetical protein JCM1840_002070 [Sporobolomyces johnsonii]
MASDPPHSPYPASDLPSPSPSRSSTSHASPPPFPDPVRDDDEGNTTVQAGVERDEEDTFYSMLSIAVDAPIGSMSISPANRDVALGARKGLFICDLQNPWDPPRFLPHDSAWEVADVQWNPFPSRSEWVVSTSNQQAVVYNLSLAPSLSVSPVEHTLYGHTRAVTDINWSPGAPEILATCALDGWVLGWDLRTGYGARGAGGRGRKPIWRTCGWGAPATQVKWNRREPHVIASSHDNAVLIWDDRMGAAPVTTIMGHSAKIYGIDWSRKDARQLVTCSLDKTFKFWSLNDPSTPAYSVSTASPVWRARWLPFGDGVLTLPQRSEHALSIWGEEKLKKEGQAASPVARFEGAREGVKEFVWRTRGGEDMDSDDREFQLVTWAKDRRLRLWPISDAIMREVGHVKGAPIKIPVTRRGGPDVSYRSFAEAPAPPLPLTFAPSTSSIPKHLVAGSSLLSASLSSPSLLTSSLRNASFPASPTNINKENLVPPTLRYTTPADPLLPAATMTTTKVRSRRQRAHDRLAWMEGVKVIKPVTTLDDDLLGDEGDSKEPGDERPSEPTTRASSLVRGTDGGTVTAREGGDTERAESIVTGDSLATGTATGKDATYANLGEEITSVVRRFPRVNFEKVHVAGRTCTVSLYSPLFLRATFSFPKKYPSSAPPAIELERSADISLKHRATLLQGVRKVMASRAERSLPSLEVALRYLLGDKSFDRIEEDDDDEAEEILEGSALANLPPDLLRNNANVPPPRRGGATFGPSGQLVVFFPTNVFVSSASDKDGANSPPDEPTAQRPKFPLRLSESFGNLPSESPDYEGEYQETDEALQVSTGHSYRPYCFMRRKTVPLVPTPPVAPSFSTTVKIKDVSHLTLLDPSRTVCSLNKPPLAAAKEALDRAMLAKDMLLARVWATMVAFMESGLGSEGGLVTSRLDSLLAERLLRELMMFLAHLKDVQTLGIIACLLEAYTRNVEDEVRRRAIVIKPEIDYFNHQHRRLEEDVASEGTGERTPLPTNSSYQRRSDPSHSPRPSWANLSGFFNASMLSLRSGTSSNPSSPDRTTPTRPMSVHGSSGSPQLSPGLAKSPLRPVQTPFPSISRMDADGRAPRVRSKTSPNVTFGGTSVAVLPPKISSSLPVVPEQQQPQRPTKRVAVQLHSPSLLHQPVCWWLTDRAMLELELIRLAYAELLRRWGLDTQRVEVLKLCRSPRVPSPRNEYATQLIKAMNGIDATAALELPRSCVHCGAVVQMHGEACTRCKKRQRAVLCVLCHLPVTGLTASCSKCCHLGHLDCLQRWYSAEDDCPTGCGCSCTTSGGLSGLFPAPSAKLPPPSTFSSSASSNPTKTTTPSWVPQSVQGYFGVSA